MKIGLGVEVTEVMVVQSLAIRTEKLLDLTYVKRIAHATVLRIHSGEEKGSGSNPGKR